MKDKVKLILFANIYAIVLTTLIYVDPSRFRLWIALEIIILPLIYSLGYEIIMQKQKNSFEKELNIIEGNKNILKLAIGKLHEENQKLRKKLNSSRIFKSI